jgi:pterin-4a-carbinolamine dehydratase
MAKVSNDRLEKFLEKNESWMLDDQTGKLLSGFELEDFSQSIDFANGVAEIAEENNQTPDILIHDTNYVTLFVGTKEEVTDQVDAFIITEENLNFVEAIEKELQNIVK